MFKPLLRFPNPKLQTAMLAGKTLNPKKVSLLKPKP